MAVGVLLMNGEARQGRLLPGPYEQTGRPEPLLPDLPPQTRCFACGSGAIVGLPPRRACATCGWQEMPAPAGRRRQRRVDRNRRQR